MKTVFARPFLKANRIDGGGFTLVELLVVIAVIAVLASVRLAVITSAKDQTRIGQCAGNVRQITLTTQIYANENNDKLPTLTGNAAWAWDMPTPVANAMLASGVQKKTFYCPGTSPRFDDNLNYLNPSPNSLWEFANFNGFHIIGYLLAFSGPNSLLILSNQNTTILPEPPKLTPSVNLPTPSSKDRVLVADATISENLAGTAANPVPAGSFNTVQGGFVVPHTSPHLRGTLPAGGNLGFKDGHVQWRKFPEMNQRASGGRGFWW